MLCADREREQKGLCSIYQHVLSGLHTQVVWQQAGVWQLTDKSSLWWNWAELMWLGDNGETIEVDNL